MVHGYLQLFLEKNLCLTLDKVVLCFHDPVVDNFLEYCGKNRAFLLFPQCFAPIQRHFNSATHGLLYAITLGWNKSKFSPFPNDRFLESSKLKEFADDNFEFDENSKKFSERVENTVGKGEIAHYEQFLLFP